MTKRPNTSSDRALGELILLLQLLVALHVLIDLRRRLQRALHCLQKIAAGRLRFANLGEHAAEDLVSLRGRRAIDLELVGFGLGGGCRLASGSRVPGCPPAAASRRRPSAPRANREARAEHRVNGPGLLRARRIDSPSRRWSVGYSRSSLEKPASSRTRSRSSFRSTSLLATSTSSWPFFCSIPPARRLHQSAAMRKGPFSAAPRERIS